MSGSTVIMSILIVWFSLCAYKVTIFSLSGNIFESFFCYWGFCWTEERMGGGMKSEVMFEGGGSREKVVLLCERS